MKRALLAASRVLVGGIFIWAAVSKISDPRSFGEDIANYQMLPPALVPWLAAAVPGIELVAGGLLVLGVWSRAAATVITGLLLVFIAALSQALLRGINLKCGCFGGADLATWGTVGRDLVILLPALAVLLWGGGTGAFGETLTVERAPADG
jgi:uncharacterized membrane protein YphA (DoxX/SURF4 family)